MNNKKHKHIWKFDYSVYEGTFYLCLIDGCSAKGKLTKSSKAIRKVIK